MYSRNYSDDEHVFRIPEGYDGTALSEQMPREDIRVCVPEQSPREVKISPRTDSPKDDAPCEEACEKENRADASGLPLFLRRLLPCELGLGVPRLGAEELLIGAVALCVLFSEEKDFLCAIMLLLLIFVT